MVSHLIDRQDTVQDHVGLGGAEAGHYQTGAIAEQKLTIYVERLEVFGLARCGRNRDLLLEEHRVDGAAFTNVWVSNQTDRYQSAGDTLFFVETFEERDEFRVR